MLSGRLGYLTTPRSQWFEQWWFISSFIPHMLTTAFLGRQDSGLICFPGSGWERLHFLEWRPQSEQEIHVPAFKCLFPTVTAVTHISLPVYDCGHAQFQREGEHNAAKSPEKGAGAREWRAFVKFITCNSILSWQNILRIYCNILNWHLEWQLYLSHC